LIAAALGCDVNLNSVVTPAPLLSFIRSQFFSTIESYDDKYLAMKKYLVNSWQSSNDPSKKKKRKKDTSFVSNTVVERKEYNEMLDIFVDAFIYEPANTVSTTNNLPTRQRLIYIHQPPNKILNPYIHALMDQASTELVDCCVVLPDLPVCIGCGEGSHIFLKSEGICRCEKCNEILSRECTFIKENENETTPQQFCYNCYNRWSWICQ
jgi:hypothetical protein